MPDSRTEDQRVKHLRNKQYVLSRGTDLRPFQFDGVVIAETETDRHRAAIYRTKGGKFVTEFSVLNSDRAKAEVHVSLDLACEWFKPGRLTQQLLRLLGRWKPEVIE